MKIKLLIMLLLLSSCASKQLIKPVPVMTRVENRVRLVPVKVDNDSSSLKALFECDSTMQVVLKAISEMKGVNVSSDFTFEKNLLSYKANFKPRHDSIIVRDSLIYREVPIEIPVEVKVNELHAWQKVLMWLGAAMLAIIIFKIGRYVV